MEVIGITGRSAPLVGVVLVAALTAGAILVLGSSSSDVALGIVVALGLLVISTPLLVKAVAGEIDPFVRRVILASFSLKFMGALARYYVAFVVYGGQADAKSYVEWGSVLAPQFRAFEFAPAIGTTLVGTGFVRYVTGLLFAVTGPTTLGGFLVFSWLSFWGLFAFYRAFRHALPDIDHRRYTLLVLLLPSLLFWPSSIGKEALVVTGLGAATYGAAKVYQRSVSGWLPAAAGTLLVAMVRPHVAAVLVAAMGSGFLFRGRGNRKPLFGPAGQVIGLVVFAVVALAVVRYTETHFGLEGESTTANVTSLLTETERRTGQGGSEFDQGQVTSVRQLPGAALTVLFRPWPHEAENAQQLITAFESFGLLLFGIVAWRRVFGGIRRITSEPFLRMSFVFTVLFVFAFSAVGNFGILARQRAQVLPFALVFIALPYLIAPKHRPRSAIQPPQHVPVATANR